VIALIAGEGEDAVAEAAPVTKAEEPAAEAKAPKADAETPHQMPTAARELVAAVAHTHEDPEAPAGTELVKMTVREALKEAMP